MTLNAFSATDGQCNQLILFTSAEDRDTAAETGEWLASDVLMDPEAVP